MTESHLTGLSLCTVIVLCASTAYLFIDMSQAMRQFFGPIVIGLCIAVIAASLAVVHRMVSKN